jgi:tRNA 2-selenouridine synthase
MKKRNVFLQSLMAIQKITIEEFLLLAKTNLVLDVRSPSEYIHAHIPNAKSLPLFNDDERKIVGTAYKQESKQTAIKLGLDFFGGKMREIVEDVERLVTSYGLGVKGSTNAINIKKNNRSNIIPFESVEKKIDVNKPSTFNPPIGGQAFQPSTVLLHCWRGGMRSAGVAWLLDLYGFKVYTLVGGYKAYRNWVIQQFEQQYHFKIIGGYTGSGKTLLLHALAKEKNAIIDLEALANHKGSALGALGQAKQPTQEMFENLLAKELQARQQTTDNRQQELNRVGSKLNEPIAYSPQPTAHCIWMEDESQRIGNLILPQALWLQMRCSKVYFFDIPFEERLNYLTAEYGVHKKDELVTAIMRIQKRLGGLETKNAINFLLENNFKECFRILLAYYDKYYFKGLYNRENGEELITTIETEKVDTNKNVELLNTFFKKANITFYFCLLFFNFLHRYRY